MADTCSRGELSSTCGVGSPTAVSCASGGLPEDMLFFSASTAKGLVAGTGSAGFAEVDGGAVPQLGSIEEAGLVNFTLFFFEEEGATHSRTAGIVICGESKCRSLKVDANVRGVLPREVAQAVKVPTILEGYGVGSGDVGKELPRGWSRKCLSFGADMPVAFLETGSRMHIFRDTLGSTMVVRGALHT